MSKGDGLSRISGWGNALHVDARELVGEDLARIVPFDSTAPVIARGLGRSYGDASLPADEGGVVLSTRLSDRWLGLDIGQGVLRAEAGTTLRQLVGGLLDRGWFVPVCPGTQDVTLGGMVAADVHGKNHHRAGSIGCWIRSLRVLVAEDRVIDCSPDRSADLFWATIGGMGLTGVILDVELQLVRVPSPWIWQRTTPCRDVRELSERLCIVSQEYPFTVGWVDLFADGRSRLFAGRWATVDEAPSSGFVPRSPRRIPRVPLCSSLIRLANLGYRSIHRSGATLVPVDRFFFPLDRIANWNRLYGESGFTQYQCVVPWGDDRAGASRVIEAFLQLGGESYLTVVKDFGAEGAGVLSFPRPGVTITFDVPIRGEGTKTLVRELNERVIGWGGRVYLAKDAFTTEEQFRRMEPRLSQFDQVRRRWELRGRFRSALLGVIWG